MGLAAGWSWSGEPSHRGLCLATWLIHSPNSSEKRRPRLGRSRTETSKTRSLLASIRGRSAGMSAHWDHVARDPGRSPRATASVRGRVSRLPPNRAPPSLTCEGPCEGRGFLLLLPSSSLPYANAVSLFAYPAGAEHFIWRRMSRLSSHGGALMRHARRSHCLTGDKFRLVIATTLREDGYPDDGEYNPADTGPSRADSFEYVMYGKIYRIEGDDITGETTRLGPLDRNHPCAGRGPLPCMPSGRGESSCSTAAASQRRPRGGQNRPAQNRTYGVPAGRPAGP
ncbi:hypothetical protein HPB50_018033 [Hyalomma asiaticum]|uniref:Uncharacterized protein n=1 Tax=Hyalomma asiaticum TaxID=266040 RepID=A0ACB7SAN4_HYAAI|nr:hypothetical protein HPB50_018033 [Hyalomma asiaticum]